MYSYRIKVPTFFLGCMIFIAVVNVYGSYRLSARLKQLPLPPPAPISAEAFAAQLNATTAPERLREMALQEHRRSAAGHALIQSFDESCRVLVRKAFWADWIILAAIISYFLVEFRPPPP